MEESDYSEIGTKFFQCGSSKNTLIQAFLNKFKSTCRADRAFLLEVHDETNSIIITSERSQTERNVPNANEVLANDNPTLRGLLYLKPSAEVVLKDLSFQDVRIAKIVIVGSKLPNVITKMVDASRNSFTGIVNHYRLLRLSDEINNSRMSFLSLLGNEIRGPLNGIFGFLRLDNEQANGEKGKTMLKNSVKELVGTINNLVDMLHIETGKYKKPIEVTNLADHMFSVTSKAKSICRGLEIETKISDEVPKTLMIIKATFEQIILNVTRTLYKLASNKRVFINITFPNNRLTIELRCQGWDGSGNGINHETLLLDLTRKLVKHLKGNMDVSDNKGNVKFTITIDSERHHDTSEAKTAMKGKKVLVIASKNRLDILKRIKNMGITFATSLSMEEAEMIHLSEDFKDTIGLIIVEKALDDNKDHRLPKIIISKPSDISGLFKDILDVMKNKAESVSISMEDLVILHADDEETNREVMAAMLDQIGYKNYRLTEDGVEAYEEFIKDPEKYHVILTDIKMTRMGGEELSRKIDAYCQSKKIPRPTIIGVSAYAMDEDKEQIRKRAVLDDFISKPVDLDILKKKLDEV